ncbi:MAG: hypothetical protein JO235_07510 [Chroococcidiopsidaceae cyanobacterium CP_BM_RX_35]|nr:hypothetical protein [Chroococcidiopsidaceae cyanobacterium CP_BM_RX_35]
MVDEEGIGKEESREVDCELRRLRINPSEMKGDIKRYWSNIPGAITRVKKAVAEGWCTNPTGLFRKALVQGVPEELRQPTPKQYPSPSLEQLNELGALGELVHTVLDEPGNPQVLAVDTGTAVVPWWQALGLVHLEQESPEKFA